MESVFGMLFVMKTDVLRFNWRNCFRSYEDQFEHKFHILIASTFSVLALSETTL